MGAAEIIGIAAIVVAIGIGGWQVAAARSCPRPHLAIDGEPDEEGLPARLTNTGGAAVKCHALAHAGGHFYEFREPVTAQREERQVKLRQLGEAPSGAEGPFVYWTVAVDERGRWWDARRGKRIRGSINKWLKKHSEEAGLAIPAQVEV